MNIAAPPKQRSLVASGGKGLSQDQLTRLEGELSEVKRLIKEQSRDLPAMSAVGSRMTFEPPIRDDIAAPMVDGSDAGLTDVATSLAAFDELYGNELPAASEASSLHLKSENMDQLASYVAQ